MNKQYKDTSDLTGLPPRIPKTMKLNEVRLNGKDGKFVYVDVINRKDGEKPEKIDLGSQVQFIFLRQRRRIAGFNKGEKMPYISTEHIDKNDQVYLFGMKEKGTAGELYEKYKDIMHTERIVYAFLLRPQHERELVRVIIKGSTLNWKRDGKAKDTVDYFSYVQDDKREGHLYEYVTIMSPVKETGPLGDYYSLHFTLGKRLDQPKVDVVVEKLKELRDYVAEQDAYYKVAKEVKEVEAPTIDAGDDQDDEVDNYGKPNVEANKPAYSGENYPKDEIRPEDIPF